MVVSLWPVACGRLVSDGCVRRRNTGAFANDQRPTTNGGRSLRLVLALLFRFLNRFAELLDGGNLRRIE